MTMFIPVMYVFFIWRTECLELVPVLTPCVMMNMTIPKFQMSIFIISVELSRFLSPLSFNNLSRDGLTKNTKFFFLMGVNIPMQTCITAFFGMYTYRSRTWKLVNLTQMEINMLPEIVGFTKGGRKE